MAEPTIVFDTATTKKADEKRTPDGKDDAK